jgi:hypothetical protein
VPKIYSCWLIKLSGSTITFCGATSTTEDGPRA